MKYKVIKILIYLTLSLLIGLYILLAIDKNKGYVDLVLDDDLNIDDDRPDDEMLCFRFDIDGKKYTDATLRTNDNQSS